MANNKMTFDVLPTGMVEVDTDIPIMKCLACKGRKTLTKRDNTTINCGACNATGLMSIDDVRANYEYQRGQQRANWRQQSNTTGTAARASA
jgi:hypothetical protein